MTQHLRLANAGPAEREIGDWAETETAKDIQRSLDLVVASDRPAMTMIAGGPGIGKSSAVKMFASTEDAKVTYIEAARGEGTPWNFAQCLARHYSPYGDPGFRSISEARLQIASYYFRPGHVLVVDEAQYLNQYNQKTRQTGETFEWLRSLSEDSGCDLVFCRDMNLPRVIENLPQLRSRMIRPVIVPQASRADVAAVVEGTAFAQRAAVDALHAIAGLKGGLRNVENVTRIAQLFAGQNVPTLDHLKAAIVDMKLAPKGGF